MENSVFNNLTGVLELIGQGFNKGISIIDNNYRIVWVNSILEKKGFRLSNVKGTFYQKTFDNKENLDEEDLTYKSMKSGTIIEVIKKGSDNEQYKIVSIPIKDTKGNVAFVVEFTKNLVDYDNEEVQKLKDFIFERELKMVKLKNRIKELEEKLDKREG